MRLPKLAAATIMAALLAACGPSSEPSGEVGTGPGGAGAVKIVARDTFFEPESLEVTAGDEITVEVTNNGDTTHDFAIGELDLNTGTIEPGTTKTATFKVPAGTTKFACTYHRGMEGTIETD